MVGEDRDLLNFESIPGISSPSQELERALCDKILKTTETNFCFDPANFQQLFEGSAQKEDREGLGPEPFIINFQTEMQHPSLSTSVEDTAAVEQVLEPHQNSSPATRLCDIDVAWIKSASQKHAEMQINLDKVATKTGLSSPVLLPVMSPTIHAVAVSPMQVEEKLMPTKAKYIGKLTVEERKRRVARYLEKKKRRVWGRKVEYQCRKNIANKRVRVNGRFA
jgi:hypothetical protein